MVETVCLRLAAGLISAVVILDPRPIPPRFLRVQHLTTLGLLAIAMFLLIDRAPSGVVMPLSVSAVLTIAGSIIWHTEDAPGGVIVNVLAALFLMATLVCANLLVLNPSCRPILVADDLLSASVLGMATTAMLMGHSYLIAPAMSIAPLQRLLIAFGIVIAIRIGSAGFGLWQWTAEHPLGNLSTETLLWLSARWLLGLFAPLGLGWMAWECARIRSTQAATGILYVVVIVTFLGELTSLLLLAKTGSIL